METLFRKTLSPYLVIMIFVGTNEIASSRMRMRIFAGECFMRRRLWPKLQEQAAACSRKNEALEL